VLADQGADVIKIEPLTGDFFRKVGPFAADDNLRAYGGVFQSCNRNKRSIAIDLKNKEGRTLFKELVASSDAVIENFRAGVLDKMGLGYEELKKINPRLVYTSIRGFGDSAGGESPYKMWPSFDIVAQAMGGWMGITGPDKDTPTKVGGGPGDTVPGLFAAMGTLTALWHARETGEGQYVDIAMVDCVLAMCELVTAVYGYLGESPFAIGNRMRGLAPFDTYPAKDGCIVIAAPHNPLWKQLCEVMGRPELIDDERCSTEEARASNQELLREVISDFTSKRTKEELKTIFGGVIPFGPVYTAKEIFEDPHFTARNMFSEVEQPGTDLQVKISNTPIKLSNTPGGVTSRAPLVGEHTAEILAEFGLGPDRIDKLKDTGAIR